MSARAGGFGITNIEQLDFPTRTAFEELIVQLQAWVGQEHYGDGSHKDINVDSVTTPTEDSRNGSVQLLDESHGHLWTMGPWCFDAQGGTPRVACLRPPETSGTLNNWAPQGIDSAIIIELEPGSSSTITITGLKPGGSYRRLLVLGNRDSGGGLITLKHQDTGSDVYARFRLPGNVDVTLASGEYVWLFYDLDAGRWRMLITAQQAGGITQGVVDSGAVTGDVLVASVTVTDTQIKSLSSSPVTLVAAQGAGTIIVPLMITMKKVTTVAYNTNVTTSFPWTGITTAIAGTVNLAFSSGVETRYASVTPTAFNDFANNPENKAFTIKNSADLTGGGSGNSLQVRVVYFVMSV